MYIQLCYSWGVGIINECVVTRNISAVDTTQRLSVINNPKCNVPYSQTPSWFLLSFLSLLRLKVYVDKDRVLNCFLCLITNLFSLLAKREPSANDNNFFPDEIKHIRERKKGRRDQIINRTLNLFFLWTHDRIDKGSFFRSVLLPERKFLEVIISIDSLRDKWKKSSWYQA